MGIELERAPTLETPLTAVANRTADSCTVKVTRPNNTTTYTANDVLGVGLVAAAGPATLIFTFPKLAGALANGGEIMITSVEFSRETTGLISGETSYNLYLYNTPPGSALLDNAAFDITVADLQQLVDKVSCGTPVDEGTILYIRQDGVNHQIKVLGNTIYGYLVTVGGYTPVGLHVHNITVHALAL